MTSQRELRVCDGRQARNQGVRAAVPRGAQPWFEAAALGGTCADSCLAEVKTLSFSAKDGLLFQTQFQQPAILLQEKAAFEHYKSNGAYPSHLP